MIAACARYIDVVNKVGSSLGVLSRAEKDQAKTCMYAIGRAREVLAVLKWSKSEEQRCDYHVILGALVPRCTANDSDSEGMVCRVAKALGVRAGKRCASTPIASTLVSPTLSLPCTIHRTNDT